MPMPVSWAVCWLPRSDGPRGPSPACPHALDIARPCHGGLSTLLLIPTGRRRKLASSLASTAAYRRCCCCVCGARIALGQASRPLSGPSPRHVTRRFVLCAGRRWPPEPADATRRRVCAVLTLPVTGRGQAKARTRRLLSSPLLSSPLLSSPGGQDRHRRGQGRAGQGRRWLVPSPVSIAALEASTGHSASPPAAPASWAQDTAARAAPGPHIRTKPD